MMATWTGPWRSSTAAQAHRDHDQPHGRVQRFEQTPPDRPSVSAAGTGSAEVEPGYPGQDRAVPARVAQMPDRRLGAAGEQADPDRRLLVVVEVGQVVVLAHREVILA